MTSIIKKLATCLLLITMCMGLIGTNTVYAEKKVLNLSKYSQEKSQWCWVTGGQIIVKYHTKQKISQCQLYKWGKRTSTCTNKPGSFNELRFAFGKTRLKELGRISTSPGAYRSIVTEIKNNRPILARLAWKSTDKKTAHAAPIRGFDTNKEKVYWIYINQQPTTSEYRISSYGHFKNNSSWKWTHSMYGMK